MSKTFLSSSLECKNYSHSPHKKWLSPNSSLFGTSQDNTNIGMNNFYKTKNNLPYALLIPDEFDYPQEKKAINNGHLKFANWAQSSGTILNDWYKNISGYRNTSNIYSH